MTSRNYVSLVLAIVGMTNGIPLTARGQELSKDIVEALRRNAAALSPVTVSWELTRSSYLSLDEFTRYLKVPDDAKAMLLFPEQVTMSYQHGKLFQSRKKDTMFDGNVHPFHQQAAFDGQLAYLANRVHVPLVVSIWDAEYRNTRYRESCAFVAEYFTAAGFKIHEQMDLLDRLPESLLLYLASNEGEISDCRGVTVESTECLAVEVTAKDGRHAIILDPARDYAMLRHERYGERDQLVQTTVNDQFVELSEPHLWLPKRCKVVDYTFPSLKGAISTKPLITNSIVVTELSQEAWPDERFVIEHREPGTIIGDSRAAAAHEPGVVFNEADGRYKYQIPMEVSKARRIWIWPLSGTMIALLILVVLIHRKRRSYSGAN